MKLATFTAGGSPELGIVRDGRIIPLSRQSTTVGPTMIDLIAAWPMVQSEVRLLADEAKETLDLASVRLLAPVLRPGKIMAIGLNYADHIAESGAGTPKDQVWITKAVTSVSGPYDSIEIPLVSQFVDYEAELVAVMGQGGRHISLDAAPTSIFGYCLGNDVTERAWQHRTPQWSLGKSFDTHAPLGPWITTADEVPDPHALGIRCLVNEEVRQASNTRHLVFNIWDQVRHLSQAMTLEPGDLIFTGTPGGVGAARNPRLFLQPGDRVRIEIDNLGVIENVCAMEENQ